MNEKQMNQNNIDTQKGKKSEETGRTERKSQPAWEKQGGD